MGGNNSINLIVLLGGGLNEILSVSCLGYSKHSINWLLLLSPQLILAALFHISLLPALLLGGTEGPRFTIFQVIGSFRFPQLQAFFWVP